MNAPVEEHLSYLGLNGPGYVGAFASSEWRAAAPDVLTSDAAVKPTTGRGNSVSWLKRDSVGVSMDSTGSGDSHYGTVLRKQATELETALIAKSDLESQVRHLTSELQSHKTKLMQKEAEFKATESQLRQKASRLAALENGDAVPYGVADSGDMMDLMAEKEALQDALKAAQLELAKEQAARVNVEAKLASGGVSGSAVARRGVEESKEVSALREQLEGEQAEVAALQEALRRAEQECSASHKQALGLREEMSVSQSKLSEARAQIEHLSDRAKHLERVAEAKDVTIRELTEKVEKRIMDTLQFNGAGKIGEEDMWKLGLTHEQLSAIDQIIVKWRDGYNRKDQELYEVSEELEQYQADLSLAQAQLGKQQQDLTSAKRYAEEATQRHAEERQQLLDRVDHLTLQLEASQSEATEVTNALRDLETEKEELLHNLYELTRQLEESQSDEATVTRKLRDLESEKEELLHNLDELTRQLEASQSDEATVTRRLRDLESEKSELRSQLREQREELQHQLETSQSEAATVTRKLSELESEKAKLESQLREATEQLHSTCDELEQLQSATALEAAGAKDLEQSLDELKARFRGAEGRLAETHREMESRVAEVADLVAAVEAERRSRASREEELRVAEQRAARGEETVAELQRRLTEAESTAGGLESQGESLSQRLTAAESSRAELAESLSASTEKLWAAQAALEEAKAERDVLEREVASLRGKLTGALREQRVGDEETASLRSHYSASMAATEGELQRRHAAEVGELEARLAEASQRAAGATHVEVALAEARETVETLEAQVRLAEEAGAADRQALALLKSQSTEEAARSNELQRQLDATSQQVSTMLREREEQVSRITGIVRRTMDSIRAGYQRTSAEGAPAGGGGGGYERDDALLDVAQFNNVEDMLGSLAQFAANKSHTTLRLQQELHRKAEEIVQLEDEVQRSWSASHKESELEYVRRELAEKTSEAAELRISLGRKAEEAAAAAVEVRVLNEEVAAGRETVNHLRNQLSAAEADVARIRQEASHMAVQDVSRMREELERAHAEVIPLKEQLNRRTREVRELNHMLKAWEAMRLGKDAQIASLMERCKRHEEEAAEKARSVDSLRRKLALAGRDPSLSNNSVSGPSGSRSRHIHVHMHHQPSEAGSEYEYGSIAPGSLRSSQGL